MHKIHTVVKQVAVEAVKQRLLSKVGESAKHFPGQCSRVLKRVSERRCDGWEGRHSMQQNYLCNYYPILTYQCISSPENESICRNESCMDSEGVQAAELVKKGVEGGSKRTEGAGLQLEAAAALATWKRETRRGRTCHTSNDSDSD